MQGLVLVYALLRDFSTQLLMDYSLTGTLFILVNIYYGKYR
jgi:hypothetical protein